MIRRTINLVLLFCCLLAPTSLRADSSGAGGIRRLLNKPANKKAVFSIHFRDTASGKTIFDFNADRSLKPASNMKLIISAAALDQLGPDFTYKTHFALWRNNLVVLASGDPLIGDPALAKRQGDDIFAIFQQILQQLRKRKINNISGDLLIDDTIFDDVRYHPAWPDSQVNNWYRAQVSALNFNDNCVDINFTPATNPGQPVTFSLNPNTSYVKITNKCITVNSGPNKLGGLRPSPLGANNITLIGKCRAPHTIYIPVDRPSAYFGFVLAEYLLRHGIAVNGKLIIKKIRSDRGDLPQPDDLLLTHCTPLRDVLRECNQRSLNLVAECLLKTVGAYSSCSSPAILAQQGSWQTGRQTVRNFLNKLKIDPDDYKIDDGSGLSHNNRLSARCITSVLTHIARKKNFKLYRESLATPSVGTLAKRRRFREPAYEDRVFVKTGHITGAQALSGYCRTSSGRWLAFAIITNNHKQNPVGTIDAILKEMLK